MKVQRKKWGYWVMSDSCSTISMIAQKFYIVLRNWSSFCTWQIAVTRHILLPEVWVMWPRHICLIALLEIWIGIFPVWQFKTPGSKPDSMSRMMINTKTIVADISRVHYIYHYLIGFTWAVKTNPWVTWTCKSTVPGPYLCYHRKHCCANNQIQAWNL